MIQSPIPHTDYKIDDVTLGDPPCSDDMTKCWLCPDCSKVILGTDTGDIHAKINRHNYWHHTPKPHQP